MSNAPGRIFEQAYNSIKVNISFDSKWKNGTGYLNGAIKVPLQPGELSKSVDDYNRRVILIGTRFGTVVIFDRYKNQVDDGVYVSNKPDNYTFKVLMSGSSIGEGEMSLLVGPWGALDENIGFTIEKLALDLQ